MELNELRNKLDIIDDQIATLYGERMKIVEQVCDAKKTKRKGCKRP